MDRCEDDEQQKLREIVSKFCKELYENDSDNPSPHLVAAMIDLMTEKMENMSTGEDQQKKSLLENAKQVSLVRTLILSLTKTTTLFFFPILALPLFGRRA